MDPQRRLSRFFPTVIFLAIKLADLPGVVQTLQEVAMSGIERVLLQASVHELV